MLKDIIVKTHIRFLPQTNNDSVSELPYKQRIEEIDKDSLRSRLWTAAIFLLMLAVLIALTLFVQRATTQIKNALAEEVLQQQHDVANLLYEYSGVMLALERERTRDTSSARSAVDVSVNSADLQLQKMRSEYSFARLDGASTAHAFVKPILEDVKQWLESGVPGYESTDPVVLTLASQRMSDRYEQLRLIASETDAVATTLISEQSSYLDRFRGSLITMLGLFALLALGIVMLLIRQRNLQMQLRVDQQSHAQRIADFADIGADWFWEMSDQLELKVLSGQALRGNNSPAENDRVVEEEAIFAVYNDKVADAHWPVDSLKARRKFAEFESDWVTPSGQQRVVAMSGKPLFAPAGDFIGYRGIGRDITSRREIENELANVYQELIQAQTQGRKQAEEALRDSEQFLSISLDAMAASFAILDQDGVIRVANKAWQQVIAAAEVEGGVGIHYLDAFASSRSKDEQNALLALKGEIEDVFEGKKSSLQYEFAFEAGEELRWNQINMATFEVNSLKYGVLVYEDITSRRNLEDQDRRLRADLAHVARLTTVGEMATILAHELNQPLTAISHNSDSLLSTMRAGDSTDPEVMDTVSDIYEQAHRAGGIIQSMRQMVRKDAQASKSVDINQLVEETVRLTRPEAREHKVTVELQLSEGLPNLLIDAVQIQQVLVNLERNGVEAIRNHGALVRKLFITTVQDDDDFIRVTVQDTGPGVSSEVRADLFKSFQTTKVDGMGMGLSISRSIVEAHGGRLWLDDSVNELTTFHFTLPIEQDYANASA